MINDYSTAPFVNHEDKHLVTCCTLCTSYRSLKYVFVVNVQINHLEVESSHNINAEKSELMSKYNICFLLQCSAKNCRTAFHVTCGLTASLEMNTILTEDDEVKFKSYCPKHSGLEGIESREQDSGGEEEKESARDKKGRRRGRVRGEEYAAASSSSPKLKGRESGNPEGLSSRQQDKRVSLRKVKLQEMEDEFYQFVDVEEVAGHLQLPPEVVDFLYQYWKLKRKANFNQPLLTPKKDEEESLARREQEVLLRRLQLFTHLRQDLERVGFNFNCVRVHRSSRGRKRNINRRE